MPRKRDNQRSRVYAWQRRFGQYYRPPAWKTIDEVIQFAKPIWRSERGRYGMANVPMPLFESSSWGQRNAIAHHDHRITLPLWARQPPVVLHEMAHRLSPNDEGHGPRFVGIEIGLLARHCGYDADELKALADEMGVKYDRRSIGRVPTFPWWRRVQKLLPCTAMEAAIELDVPYRVVHGAALQLIKRGLARWYRGKLIPIIGKL